ncbi:alpha-ketoglutarate-dependent dioxygenase AlkB [Aphomia sociella]
MKQLSCPNKTEDRFMKTFKYYKSNSPQPSLDNVINIDNIHGIEKLILLKPNINEDVRTELLGLNKLKDWQTYSIKDHPGLLLIRNPFTSLGQRYWIQRCLKVYPRRPNKRNIDIDTNVEDWWAACHCDGASDKQLMKKLRWTTLGYHHNWDTKIYSDENKSPFPEELSLLCDIVARYLGYENFKAEAAIVNYYHLNSTLSAHTDHSEVNLEAPLLSFSFGQSAIFLIGGKDKTTVPSAVLLNSGDILIMSKEARLCYHAVPKVLPSTSSSWNNIDESISKQFNLNYMKDIQGMPSDFTVSDVDWCTFENYVKESRINVNVRQVLGHGQHSLKQ